MNDFNNKINNLDTIPKNEFMKIMQCFLNIPMIRNGREIINIIKKYNAFIINRNDLTGEDRCILIINLYEFFYKVNIYELLLKNYKTNIRFLNTIYDKYNQIENEINENKNLIKYCNSFTKYHFYFVSFYINNIKNFL